MQVTSASRDGRTFPQIVYHTSVAAILLSFASLMTGKPVWSFELRSASMLLMTVASYWLAAMVLIVLARRGQGVSLAARLAVSFAAAAVAFATGAILDSGMPPTLTLWTPLLGLVLLLLGQGFHVRPSWPLVSAPALLALIGVAAMWIAPNWLRANLAQSPKPAVTGFRIRSSLYDLTVRTFQNHLPRFAKPRGGIALLGDRYLLATGDGQLLVFSPAADMRSLIVRPLAYRVPLNSAEFVAASGNIFKADAFRVGGILSRQRNGLHRIFVTHHYWKSTESCWVMRVSSLEGSLEDFLADRPTMKWRTEFETKPCIPLVIAGQPARFGALESGGRLAWSADDRLLITIGDHAMDGWNSPVQAAQDLEYSFGKIIALNPEDGSNEIYSLGHRNSQGLTVASAGLVWSSEHGPEGGDELNLISKDGNYGWPFATYGTQYGTYTWPLIGDADQGADYVEPLFSWVPSIGVSSVIEVTSPRFERWHGDLLAASLRDMSFWRIRVREGRVVMTERFLFGQRIRDVVQGHDGSLVVWSDDRSISFIAPSAEIDTVSGASIYRMCARCHVAGAEGVPAAAPSLVGIVGRAVASEQDYPYSQALRDLGGIWTRDRIDAFLTNSADYAPGTSMASIAIPDAASRKAVIDHLESPDSRLDEMPDRRTRIETPQY